MSGRKIILSSLVALQLCIVNSFAADKVLATVGSENITTEDVNLLLKGQNITYDRLKDSDKQNVLNQLIDRKILSLTAYRTNIVNSKIYKETLEKVKQDLALQLWMSNMIKDVVISETNIKSYYDTNKNKFKKPLELKAKHILVKSEKEAKDIIANLNKARDLKGEFIKIAKAKSTDGAASNGGELGWFTLDKMIPEFSMAASLLKVGTITLQPVVTKYGYHVIYLDGKKEPSLLSYAEAKNDIKQFLSSEEFKKRVENIIKTEKSKVKIVIKK